MGLLLGFAAACGASLLYAIGLALQALEARAAPVEHALRFSLLRRLAVRKRWLAGTALGLAGWALQALALVHAPLTLVQPLLAGSLIVLLGLAARVLDEPVGRRERLAVLAIAVGAPLLAVASPARSSEHAGGPSLWIALAVLAGVALAPLALRGGARAASIVVPVGAGIAYSLDGLATKLASDDYVHRLWAGAAVWFAAMLAASALGTLSEMSALQRRPVSQVAPIVFALNTYVPVGLAPLLAHEWWPASPARDLAIVASLALIAAGALVLARSAPVARVLASDASTSRSGTGRRPRDERLAASAASELRA